MSEMEIRTNVSLRILGAGADPDAISAEMHVQPDESHREGDAIQSRSPATRKHGFWGITSSKHMKPSVDMNEHIMWLVDAVGPKLPLLQAYKNRGWIVDVWIGIHSSAGHGGPVLQPGTLVALGSLQLDVNLDLYPDA